MDRRRRAQRPARHTAHRHALRSRAPLCVGRPAPRHSPLRIHGDAGRDRGRTLQAREPRQAHAEGGRRSRQGGLHPQARLHPQRAPGRTLSRGPHSARGRCRAHHAGVARSGLQQRHARCGQSRMEARDGGQRSGRCRAARQLRTGTPRPCPQHDSPLRSGGRHLRAREPHGRQGARHRDARAQRAASGKAILRRDALQAHAALRTRRRAAPDRHRQSRREDAFRRSARRFGQHADEPSARPDGREEGIAGRPPRAWPAGARTQPHRPHVHPATREHFGG